MSHSSPSVPVSPDLPPAIVGRWKAISWFETFCKRCDLFFSDNADGSRVRIAIIRQGALVGKDDGHLKIDDCGIHFNGLRTSFTITARYVTTSLHETPIIEGRNSSQLSFSIFHPAELITLTFYCQSHADVMAIREAFNRYMERRSTHLNEPARYPPLSSSGSCALESVAKHSEIALLVGALWQFCLGGATTPLLAISAFFFAVVAILNRTAFHRQADYRTEMVSTDSASLLPDFPMTLGYPFELSAKVSYPQVVTSSDAIVPRPRATSTVKKFTAWDIAVGRTMADAVLAIAEDEDWVCKIEVRTEDDISRLSDPILTDIGLLRIGDSALAFQGINFSFRTGYQFIDWNAYDNVRHNDYYRIPLYYPGKTIWLYIQITLTQKHRRSMSDELGEFKTNGQWDSFQSVYPPIAIYEPLGARFNRRRILYIAISALGLALCFIGPISLGLTLMSSSLLLRWFARPMSLDDLGEIVTVTPPGVPG